MLAVNTVLRFDQSDDGSLQRIVILWISDDGSAGWSLDLEDPKSVPQPFRREDFERHLDQGACIFDAPNQPVVTAVPSLAEQAVRDTRWAACRGALTCEPDVYVPARRTELYREVAEKAGVSLNTSRKIFQDFWRGGLVAAALTPSFGNRGGKGISREPGTLKLGRPRTAGSTETGLNLNREQKRAVATIAKAQYRRQKKHRLVATYRLWLDRLFFCNGVLPSGQPGRVPRPEYERTGVPTLDQFNRVYYDLEDIIEAKRISNPRTFALNSRPLTGTATASTWGPGSRYLIDATMADIYLVSRSNRHRVVGRPVVYVVIDVWSRLIVGLYVAIEDASWTSAMMALANAAGSKVEYCSEHGIEIGEHEWPAASVAARLMSDRGEVDGHTAGNLVQWFNCTVEATAAYRGDLKGLVETQFNTLQVSFGDFVPGYVAKDFKTRGARDYRLDAVFDINEFTATMIDLVLARNSKVLTKYDRDQGMPADTVKVSPVELWHWGLAHRTGRMKMWTEEYIRFRLMPTAEVTVDRNGIRFQSRSYVHPCLHRMMSLARMGKAKRVTISFDPRLTDTVYFHSDAAEHGFIPIGLHDNSRAFANLTVVEADQESALIRSQVRNAATRDVTTEINVGARMRARVAEAKAKKGPDIHTTKREKLGGIRENRAGEKQMARKRHAEAFRPAAIENSRSDVVVPIRPRSSVDYSESSLTDLLGD